MNTVSNEGNQPLLSLCIPTNGVKQWVLPVLDSIYSQSADENKFEVVITDNGSDREFEDAIQEYRQDHVNLNYYKSNANGFLCQIDCFKNARGEFIKFVNHRFKIVEGGLAYLLAFVEENLEEKPVTFFANGNVKDLECASFDGFVRGLSYWSSWSGGLAFWKKDLAALEKASGISELFPHTSVLFIERKASKYIISNRKIMEEMNTGHTAKGKYNLFYAFAVEYPSIIAGLLTDHDISVDTCLSVKDELLTFLADLYINFIMKKQPASYSFEDYDKYLKVYYSDRELRGRIAKRLCARVKSKAGL